ncbi:glycosyltransferase [Phascolarctobacterium sp.]
MLRILHVVGQIPVGGVGAFLVNALAKLDKNKAQFSFVMFPRHEKSDFIDNIIKHNASYFVFEYELKLSNFADLIREVYLFFRDHKNEFDVIHVHAHNLGWLFFPVAKLFGIKVRILHSHSTRFAENKLRIVRNQCLNYINMFFVTQRFACSEAAGKFLFKKKSFEVIENGIELSKYEYNCEIREKIRKSYTVSDNLILGHVGNFVESKNHKLLLEIFAAVLEKNHESELWLIGDGKLRKEIEEEARQQGILENIKFWGRRNDVEKLLQAIDVFILPSLFEGFGIVILEAQAAGLPCIISDKCASEVAVTDLVKVVALERTPEYWAEQVLFAAGKTRSKIIGEALVRYDLSHSVLHLINAYDKAVMQIKIGADN